MPISGLVVTLSDHADHRRTAIAALGRHPAIDVGELAGPRVPIVTETRDSDEDRRLWEWLHALPGVAFVTVASIHFDESEAAETETAETEAVETESSKEHR